MQAKYVGEGKLEFCDLRELQDTIQTKSNWSNFEPRFSNKEALATRFNQLAELRNGLRHSRAVDEITRKDGEAAILWFQHVLAKSASPSATSSPWPGKATAAASEPCLTPAPWPAAQSACWATS